MSKTRSDGASLVDVGVDGGPDPASRRRSLALRLLRQAHALDGLRPFVVVHSHEYGIHARLMWAKAEPTTMQVMQSQAFDFEPDRGEYLDICELADLACVVGASRQGDPPAGAGTSAGPQHVRGAWIQALDDLLAALEIEMSRSPAASRRFGALVDALYLAEHRDGPPPGWETSSTAAVAVGPHWWQAAHALVEALARAAQETSHQDSEGLSATVRSALNRTRSAAPLLEPGAQLLEPGAQGAQQQTAAGKGPAEQPTSAPGGPVIRERPRD